MDHASEAAAALLADAKPNTYLADYHNNMVLLSLTPSAAAALKEYARIKQQAGQDDVDEKFLQSDVGSPIQHHELVGISKFLVEHDRENGSSARNWRLDTLLKGATVYQPPPPPKPDPTPEFKALMQRLREQEERRQYERMINPPTPTETFGQRFPNSATPFGAGLDVGYNAADEVDDVTYADVNRQMILIINVLISIICTSVAVWMAARRWSVPERLGLSFSSSTVVAVAEVAIYMGYIRRIKEAKTKEKKAAEKKEIVDTWVIDGKSASTPKLADTDDTLRYRKGKHR